MVNRNFQLLKCRRSAEEVDISKENAIAIGPRAFYRNKRVENIHLPKTLSAIKAQAFSKCYHLQSVEIDANANVGVSTESFSDCYRLKNVKNDTRIVTIGSRAFKNCYALGEFSFGNNLQKNSVGTIYFENCFSDCLSTSGMIQTSIKQTANQIKEWCFVRSLRFMDKNFLFNLKALFTHSII